MAEAVHRRGHRVSWQAIGVDGSGLLGARIDRVLRSDVMIRMSRGRRLSVAAGCATVLLLAIACRQQIAPTPLREDPALAKQLAEQPERTKRFEAARDLTPAEADVLEARISTNPDDWDAQRAPGDLLPGQHDGCLGQESPRSPPPCAVADPASSGTRDRAAAAVAAGPILTGSQRRPACGTSICKSPRSPLSW